MAMSVVFDAFQRFDDTPKKNAENYYNFYNRSAWPKMESIREFIELCVSNYPDSDVKELIARIKSGNDMHFRSATFELFLHEALIRTGFKLVPHPKLKNGSKNKPDFLVSDPEGKQFYLEAVLANEVSKLDDSGEAIKGVVLDTLSRFPHENFMISIRHSGNLVTPPSAKKLKNQIHEWLSSLNPDEIQKQINLNDLSSLPAFEWEHENWKLEILPIPLKIVSRGKSKTLIGMESSGARWLDAWRPIRNAIKNKGSKYGNLDFPLVIAVNSDSFKLETRDEMQALFGEEQYVFSIDGDNDYRIERNTNGAWIGKKGPKTRRVASVWIFKDLSVSSLEVAKSTVYYNPWALLPAPNSLKCFPFAIPVADEMTWQEGLSLRKIFNIE